MITMEVRFFSPWDLISCFDLVLFKNRHSWIQSFTETVSEILGKHRQKKKSWVTADTLDLCGKRRELRKKRLETEGSERKKWKVNDNIKRCTKKAKENWIGAQGSKTEENLRKNNNKRAYLLAKDLTIVFFFKWKKESYYHPGPLRKLFYRRNG